MFHENKTDGDILRNSTLFNAFNRILKRAKIDKMPIHAFTRMLYYF
ncbi:hypothetical protein BQ1740_2426 [Bacillus subtilis]|nr:hypothetical protein BQ1740_2426 [Bacillus subtilis]